MRFNCVRCFPFVLSVLLVLVAGCPTVQDLPETFDVAISATEKASAPRDSGPISLAQSSWAGFRDADPVEASSTPESTGEVAVQSEAAPGPYGGLLNGGILERPPVGEQIFVVDFGDAGQMTAIHENLYFLPQYYGTEVPVGGTWSPSTLPFASFRSASYGVEQDDRYGLAVVVQVRLGNIPVGRAIIYSWGTLGADRLEGKFGYLLDFTEGIGQFLLMTGGDQYPFHADRQP